MKVRKSKSVCNIWNNFFIICIFSFGQLHEGHSSGHLCWGCNKNRHWCNTHAIWWFDDWLYEYLDGHFSGWQFLPPPAGLHPGHGHQASEVQHQEAGQEGGRPRERDVRQVCPLQEKCPHHLLVLELSLNTNKKQKQRSLVIGGHRDVSDSPEPKSRIAVYRDKLYWEKICACKIYVRIKIQIE